MVKIVVNAERCKGCGLCLEVCPNSVLKLGAAFNKTGHHFISALAEEKCTGCKQCTMICPDVAIELYQVGRGSRSKTQIAKP